MNPHALKHHACTRDHGTGILLVDVETESIPCTDAGGNRQYYCLEGQHVFAVDAHDNVILNEEEYRLEIFYQ
jgi:hypothetical protein